MSTVSAIDQLPIESARVEQGSFRDRKARVFYYANDVYRALNHELTKQFHELNQTKFFTAGMNSLRIVKSEEVHLDNMPLDLQSDNWSAVIKHDRIPYVSYPYEWSFGMLKDAAILQLELILEALKEDFIVKDSSAYNIQWIGHKPIFIDTASFEKYQAGDLWAGYRQFCQMFLYPLILNSYKNISFQPLLRGSIDGLSPSDVSNMLSLGDMFRAGVLKHVYLQAKLQNSYKNSSRNVRQELKELGFHKELIIANVKSLKRLVGKLNLRVKNSVWTDYAHNNSYDADGMNQKISFVGKNIARQKRDLVWDIGSNTGTFSKIAAQFSKYVLAIDADHLAVEHFYQHLKNENIKNILPLVSNLANPSPNQGWRGQERKGLTERGKPDLVLSLALIHHAVISANIPLTEFIDWLAMVTDNLIIEFVSKEDVMVKVLLANKADIYDDYTLENFENSIQKHYRIDDRLPLTSGTRTLYYCTAK